jgi:hypothetical protein
MFKSKHGEALYKVWLIQNNLVEEKHVIQLSGNPLIEDVEYSYYRILSPGIYESIKLG